MITLLDEILNAPFDWPIWSRASLAFLVIYGWVKLCVWMAVKFNLIERKTKKEKRIAVESPLQRTTLAKTRIIIEVDADIEMLESLLQPAMDEGVISVLAVLTRKNPPATSIVEDWASETRELNRFRSHRRK